MSDPSGKVQLINAGDMLQPACCFMCGLSSYDKPYANPNTYIDYYGNLYLCESCVVELAQFWGMVLPEEHNRVCAERDDMFAAMDKMRSELARYSDIESFIRDRALTYTDPAVSSGDSGSFTPSELPDGTGEPEQESGPTGEQSTVDAESTTGIGPDDIDELTNVDQLIGLP